MRIPYLTRLLEIKEAQLNLENCQNLRLLEIETLLEEILKLLKRRCKK